MSEQTKATTIELSGWLYLWVGAIVGAIFGISLGLRRIAEALERCQ